VARAEFGNTTREREVTAGLIDVVHRRPIAVVTLRRPPANAMNLELTEEIAAVFQRLGKDRRALVLTGQGKSFCAGVDLKTVPDFDEADQRRMVDALNRASTPSMAARFRWWAPSTVTPSRADSCWRCAATNASRHKRNSLPA